MAAIYLSSRCMYIYHRFRATRGSLFLYSVHVYDRHFTILATVKTLTKTKKYINRENR